MRIGTTSTTASMKKLLSALLLALLLQTGGATAQSIRLRLPDTTALVGSSFLLPVYADSAFTGLNVISYQVQLNYTTSHLLADSLISTGTLSAGANPIANFGSSGVVTVAAATATPLSGTGVLFYIRFRVVSSAGGYSSTVSFSSAANTYLNQGSPALTFRNATITVPALPSITVSPNTATVIVGDTVQFSANGGRQPYSWRLSDSTRGSINTLTANTARFIAGTAGSTRVVATDSNGFSGQSTQDIVVHNFRMWTRDSSRLQGTELLLPVYVSSLTPWNVLSGSFDVNLSSFPGLQLVGIDRNGTLLAGVSQTFFGQQSSTSWQVSFANATPVTGSGILCYLRIAVPNLYTSNYNFSVNLTNTLFNQQLTALTTGSNQTAIALPQINITPNTAELVAGETRQFTASNGLGTYRWSVSDSNLAHISSTGLLSARKGGVVTVTVIDSVNASRTTGNIQLYDTRIYLRDTVLIAGDTLVDMAVWMDQLPAGKSMTAVSLQFDFNNNFLQPLGLLQTGTATAGWSAATNAIGNNRYSVALAGTSPHAAAGNLFFIRFKVLPGFTVNNVTSLTNVQFTLNEGDPNYLLVNGQLRSLPCTPVATVSPSGNVTFCSNQPTQLSGSSGTAYQYQWSRNGVPLAGANNRLYTPTQSGNYTLRVSLNSSCFVVSDTVRVTINPSPIAQITPYADTLFACSGDTVVLRAYREPGYSLQWFRNGSTLSGATDTIFRATLSGSYTVRSTLNACQTTSAAQLVTIRPLPAKPTILVTGSPTCAGDSATLSIPFSNLQRQWFSVSGPIVGATDSSIRVPAGKYTVRLTDAFGCRVYADSVTVAAATASAQIDPSGPTTFCQGGQVNLDLTQSTTYVRWFRNGIQLADTIRPLTVNQSGSYTAAYRLVGNPCIFTTPAVQITVVPRPLVSLDSLAPVCANAAAFALSGGLPTGGTYVGPGVVNNSFNPGSLAPGTYTIKYGFSQNGCSDTASRTIQVYALPGTTFPAPAAVCVNSGSFALTGGLPAGGVYFGTAVTAGNFNPTAAGVGTHSVGYTTQNANGCRDTVFRTITVNAVIAASISQGASASYCAGGSVLLNANTGTGLSYQWLRNGLVLGQTAASITVSQPGSYRVVVTNASGCRDSSAVTLVSENPLPVSTITAAGPTTFCQGGSVQLNGSSAADRTYRWLLNGAPISGNLTATLTATTTGAYRLIVTNALTGCFDTSTAIAVTVNPLPAAQITPAGPTSLCAGDSVLLNAPVAASRSYQWLLNGSPVPGATQASLRVGTAGQYRVVVTNTATSCFDTSAVVTVQVNPRPGANISAAGPTTFCAGGSVMLQANTGTGLGYQWLRNGSVIVGQTTANLTATLGGDYRVVVNSAAGCADSSLSLTVNVNPLPVAQLTAAGATTFCAGDSVTLNATIGTALSYQWLLNGLPVPGANQASLRIGAAGSYRVLITNTTTSCFDTSAALNVVVNPRPVASISAAGSTTICQGSNVTLNATSGTGFSYQWLRNGAVIAGQTSASLVASLAGDYRVVVSSAAACSDSSTALTIIVNPKPDPAVLTVSVDTLFARPGSDLVWFRNGVVLAGITDSILIITQDGNYNALRLSLAGCASDTSNTLVITNVSVGANELPGLRLYPNPSEGWLRLELEIGSKEALELEVRSLTGQLVHSQSWPEGSYSQQLDINLTDLPQAMYLLKIRQGHKYRYERVLIQR